MIQTSLQKSPMKEKAADKKWITCEDEGSQEESENQTYNSL